MGIEPDEAGAARRFNLGSFDVVVDEEAIIVHQKTSQDWGKDTRFARSGTSVNVDAVSRRPLLLVYFSLIFYALGFLLIFVEDGIPVDTQLTLFLVAIAFLLVPICLYALLPLKAFAAVAAFFYILVFYLKDVPALGMAFQMIEDTVGEGYVEAFTLAAGMAPILLHIMVSQTMVTYRLRITDGSQKFEARTTGLPARRLAAFVRGEHTGRPRYEFRRILELRIPSSLLKLSKHRAKRCQYCRAQTFIECTRCHSPICAEHARLLRGYKVCLDCHEDRRGRQWDQPGRLR